MEKETIVRVKSSIFYADYPQTRAETVRLSLDQTERFPFPLLQMLSSARLPAAAASLSQYCFPIEGEVRSRGGL